ncbi:MAG: DUF4377 domain-containing protein [Pelagimonas sp.]|jgi:hypothetical protein|nr:DUF4377 domain-containing protein [Pelagimonas sp.]
MRWQLPLGSLGFMLLVACQAPAPKPAPEPETNLPKDLHIFEIGAETAPCTGVAPRQCLIVNGELFYEPIAGYTHQHGIPARICIERRKRAEPIPADVGLFTYTRTPCPETS